MARTIEKVTADSLADVRDRGWDVIPDRAKNNPVTIVWDFNKAAFETRVIKIIIDGKEAYVDLDDLNRCTRWA